MTMNLESSDRQKAPERRLLGRLLLAVVCLAGSACSSRLIDDRSPVWGSDLEAREQSPADPSASAAAQRAAADAQAQTPRRPDPAFYQPGTGRLVGARGITPIADVAEEEGQIKLNFQNADLLQFIKVVLGDMLGATYVVDPAVQGEVTMQTSRPLSKSDLVPTLELMLRMNDAAIVMDGPVYRIVPIAKAATGVRAPQLGDADLPLPRGYGVRIVPLQHVAAEEMAKILEPFVSDGKSLLRTDSKRNVVILAGDGEEMGRQLEAIRMFDVDRMKGMSVAMFTPDYVDARTLGAELEALLANPDSGLMAGMVRFLVIERLNAVMVVTPRADYLARVRGWVQRLDTDNIEGGARLFVYRVQNGKAVTLADALNRAFGFQATGRDQLGAQLAPGLEGASVQSSSATLGEKPSDATGGGGTGNGTGGGTASGGSSPGGGLLLGAAAPGTGLSGLGSGQATDTKSKVRVIADEPNNSLLIMATNREYQQILSALRQMDVVPLQVLVDVTIAEVTLGDSLKYGVEWYVKNRINRERFDGYGISTLDFTPQGPTWQPGFSYMLQGLGGDVRMVLNMLAEESNLSVLSSPSLLVLNNQEARIQVGDEVPITTQQQQAATGGTLPGTTPNIINSIQYRETGVLLTVKPRVNVSGLVTMDVKQEVSRVPQGDLQNKNELTPRIQTRKINSTVSVQSGDTIILGGLIRDNRDRSESGIPFLHKIPVVGGAFGTKGDTQQRTELLVLITPRAILDRNAGLQVTEEFRRKLNSLIPIQPGAARTIAPPRAPTPPAAPATATATAADQGAQVAPSP
jgi:general secretion pathway protein D